jgi:hypothetical protein
MHGEWSEEEGELTFDRFVLFVGSELSEKIHFDSEIEIEDVKEVEVEEAYLEFEVTSRLAFEIGLVLVPLSRVNVLNAPPTYLPIHRPLLDQVIVPTTWREPGVGVTFQPTANLAVSGYVLNGLDAHGFTAATGVRGGRQAGAEAIARDLSAVMRATWSPAPGVSLAASAYTGGAAQGDTALGDAHVTFLEADAEYARGGWTVRVEAARGFLGDAERIAAVTGETVGSRLHGYVAEAGYDILSLLAPRSRGRLSPFARWELVDPQARVPGGAVRTAGLHTTAWTFGVTFAPIDGVALKADMMRQAPRGGESEAFGELGMAFMF